MNVCYEGAQPEADKFAPDDVRQTSGRVGERENGRWGDTTNPEAATPSPLSFPRRRESSTAARFTQEQAHLRTSTLTHDYTT